MANVGIHRGTLESLIGQVAHPEDNSLTKPAIQYIAEAIAKAVDENNVRIAQDLEIAGVRLKSRD